MNGILRIREPGGRTAFTLVELLTVVAIAGILATLLLTALSSAKKASARARCIANLRQITLALNMYVDDFEKRPPSLEPLITSRYLADSQVLLCPADRTRRWGNLVNETWEPPAFITADRSPESDTPAAPLSYSYLHPLAWQDEAWKELMETGPGAGLFVCQWHGLGRPDPDQPSIQDFQGLVLRAQRDGAVVRRQVFWSSSVDFAESSFAGRLGGESLAPTDAMALAPSGAPASGRDVRWPLFADEEVR
jgi:prepilin-type N-terminal cleavage/methylation domain-containing protein